MKTSDFYYDLPQELIAQTPIDKRDASRLMTLSRKSGWVSHKSFSELPSLLMPGDCLVMNNSRVLPARLIGVTGKGSAIEVLLLRDMSDGVWECITRPGKKTQPGTELKFGEGQLNAKVEKTTESGNRLIRFEYDGIFMELLDRVGKIPLPPYIKQELEDNERYQTVYSKEIGSSAAPTAGLHFTEELLSELKDMEIDLCFITLHVGLGTFRPVRSENLEEHQMHAEHCEVPEAAAKTINRAKCEGRRIIACGTTSCRTLEAISDDNGIIREFNGSINTFIYPGYKFKCIDGIITNFHLPESTLLMLISAFAGRENVMRAYREAVEQQYRFFSFGDAMLIL